MISMIKATRFFLILVLIL